jgi:hypothetical protein
MACCGDRHEVAVVGQQAVLTRRPLLVAVFVAVACLLLAMSAAAIGAGSPKTRITASGQIGRIRINTSTRDQIIRLLGPPDYDKRGNIGQGAPRTPSYEALGYGCYEDQGVTTCAVNYYLNVRRQRLESFYTKSSAFVLPGGVYVGMPAGRASQLERKPDTGGCEQGIGLTTRKLSIYIQTQGGHLGSNNRVIGGRVSGISIDDRSDGVGVTLCL